MSADTREPRHNQTPIPETLNAEEWHLVAHVRHWCHDSTKCRLCKAELRAYKAERTLDQIISG